MEEKKFVQLKKDEYGVKEFIKNQLGKGKMSSIRIEYTPIGEKIIIATTKPGYVIGRRGERITELTEILKKKFNLENPHIEMQEIEKPEFDAQYVADEIAMALERFGSIRFKVVAYKMLERIIKAGALGVEIRLSGKLPSERAKSHRFAFGYLKKAGDTAKIVNRAEARAETIPGTIGIKVGVLPPYAKIHDQIDVNAELIAQLKRNIEANKEEEEKIKEKVREKETKKKRNKTEKTEAEKIKVEKNKMIKEKENKEG